MFLNKTTIFVLILLTVVWLFETEGRAYVMDSEDNPDPATNLTNVSGESFIIAPPTCKPGQRINIYGECQDAVDF